MSSKRHTSEKEKAGFSKLIKAWFLRERAENVRVSLSRTVGIRKSGGYIYDSDLEPGNTLVQLCKVRSCDALWLAAFDIKLGRDSHEIVESILWRKKLKTPSNNVMAGRFSDPCHWRASN